MCADFNIVDSVLVTIQVRLVKSTLLSYQILSPALTTSSAREVPDILTENEERDGAPKFI